MWVWVSSPTKWVEWNTAVVVARWLSGFPASLRHLLERTLGAGHLPAVKGEERLSIELDLLSESELEPAVLARGEIAFGRCVGGGEVRD